MGEIHCSLCMIVKDEAERLPHCLQSVQGIVDEMVVVDTGSGDHTIDIAQQFGAKVYPWTWTDDFAAARNYALQQAQGDWILVLDADEMLLPDCIPDLQILTQSLDRIAITLLRQEIGAQQNPYSLLVRLFRRHSTLRFNRPYHESIDDSISALIAAEPRWHIATLPTPAIAHTGYKPDAIVDRDKAARAARIMGRYIADHPQDAYICSKLGALYVSQGHSAAGIALLRQGLQQTRTEAAVLYELHFHLGIAYVTTGQPTLAQTHYEQACQADLPDLLKIAAYINLAALYSEQSQWQRAKVLLLHVVQIQPNLAIAHYNLGLLYKAQGQFLEAIKAYEQALILQPDYADAYQNLGVIYLKLGHIQSGLTAFQQAIALHQLSNPAEALRLRQALTEMGLSV